MLFVASFLRRSTSRSICEGFLAFFSILSHIFLLLVLLVLVLLLLLFRAERIALKRRTYLYLSFDDLTKRVKNGRKRGNAAVRLRRRRQRRPGLFSNGKKRAKNRCVLKFIHKIKGNVTITTNLVSSAFATMIVVVVVVVVACLTKPDQIPNNVEWLQNKLTGVIMHDVVHRQQDELSGRKESSLTTQQWLAPSALGISK